MAMLIVFEVVVICLVLFAIGWMLESVPYIARWLEYRKLRKELKRGRTAKELRAMRGMVRL